MTLYSSPQGRIFQVEYASEAVKQGSVVVGIVSKTHAVLVALKVPLPHPSSISSCYPIPNSQDPRTEANEIWVDIAQRRRTLLLPKENHRHRRTHRPLPGRLGFGRPRTIQLHETAIPLLAPNLRPRPPPRTPRLQHRRPRPNQHPTLRQTPLRRRFTCSRSR